MTRRALACFAAALLSTLPALGADVTGIWTGSITDRNGDPQDLSFRFIQNGETLTGKMYGDNESTPIAEAKISANHLTFSVTTELNGQITKFVYSGMVTGEEIEVSRTRSDVKAAPPSSGKPNPPQTFRLKRLT